MPQASREPGVGPDSFAKPIAFSVLEDYDKGESLEEVRRDFELFRALGVRRWRGSWGWDDYEPMRGVYDFDWLHRFAELAAREGIELRPYLGYTAPWAAAGREADGQTWNDPPALLDDWVDFTSHLAAAMGRHPNVKSYEIYNEENTKLWWDGTREEYAEVLGRAYSAIHAADPDAGVLIGGMVWPDADWLEASCSALPDGGAPAAVPFHAYPETWTPESVTVENYLGVEYREGFLSVVDSACGGAPVWINETGFATTPGKSEEAQARWWVRAIATFVAEPRVEEIGIYEIKDLHPSSPVIGDAPNYHLGLTRVDRTPKLAFHTVATLMRLLNTGTIVIADRELTRTIRAGRVGEVHAHLFRRPDGDQVLIAWDRTGGPTIDFGMAVRGSRATELRLDGRELPVTSYDGRRLRGVRLRPGEPRIFRIAR